MKYDGGRVFCKQITKTNTESESDNAVLGTATS